MSVPEAIIMVYYKGLTEYLPVSSSGHLTMDQAFWDHPEDNLVFTVMVHVANCAEYFSYLMERDCMDC